MSYCENCKTKVKGNWTNCPLCGTLLMQEDSDTQASLFLNLPLRFSRRTIVRVFTILSLFTILLYFITQWIWTFEFFGLEYVLFGLMITWMIILILIRKRRNIVKGIIYLLILCSLIGLYFDYWNGWSGWSITFVIPILSIAALIAMLISIQLVDLRAEDYVLYLQLAAIVGIIPLLFLVMNWTGHPLPSLISVILSSIVFISVLIKHKSKIKNELEKRMHV